MSLAGWKADYYGLRGKLSAELNDPDPAISDLEKQSHWA